MSKGQHAGGGDELLIGDCVELKAQILERCHQVAFVQVSELDRDIAVLGQAWGPYMTTAWAPNTYQRSPSSARPRLRSASRLAAGDGTKVLTQGDVVVEIGAAAVRAGPVGSGAAHVGVELASNAKSLERSEPRSPLAPARALESVDPLPIAVEERAYVFGPHLPTA
jgi:hypothetical protein